MCLCCAASSFECMNAIGMTWTAHPNFLLSKVSFILSYAGSTVLSPSCLPKGTRSVIKIQLDVSWGANSPQFSTELVASFHSGATHRCKMFKRTAPSGTDANQIIIFRGLGFVLLDRRHFSNGLLKETGHKRLRKHYWYVQKLAS